MRRAGERGLMRGCCLGLVLLLVLLALAGFVVDRAMAAPDLGAPPAGANDGSSEVSIAVTLGAQVAAQLLMQEHAVVTISEHDLTVIAAAQNPHPDRYRGVQVRARSGLLDVSALTSVGPLTVTVVGDVAVGLSTATSTPQLIANVTGMSIGALPVPSWLRDRLLSGFSPSVTLNQLFESSPALAALKANLECVRVVSDGIRVGIHRPGSTPDTSRCSA